MTETPESQPLIEPQEALRPDSLLADLREGRRQEAADRSEHYMRQSINGIDQIAEPDTMVSRVKTNGYDYDAYRIDMQTLISFEAIGVDTDKILEAAEYAADPPAEQLAAVTVGDTQVEVTRLGRGVAIRMKREGSKDEPSADVRGAVSRRFTASPAHQALHALNERLQRDESLPDAATTGWFDPRTDGLGTLAFLERLGFIGDPHKLAADMKAGAQPDELVGRVLDAAPAHIRRTETQNEALYIWGRGIHRYLAVDKHHGHWRYAVRQDRAINYLEEADQSPETTAVPFIETEAAREMLKWMGERGMMFAPAVQREMMRTGSADRYGSIYTQLSREVAKWVNDPERVAVENLFVPYDPEYHATRLLDKTEHIRAAEKPDDYPEKLADVRKQLAEIDTEAFGRPAAVLFGMVKEVLNRTERTSDLPVTESRIEIKDGACFDVMAYYLGASGRRPMSGASDDLRKVDIGGVPLLEKTLGAHTYLTLSETTFNGVKLPAGALLSRADDGNWAFLRLTPFVFEDEKDQASLGSEIAKALSNEQAAVRRIGGISLRHLESAV